MEPSGTATAMLKPTDTRQVLDHGFVRLVSWMGDDAAVVQAARVSYGTGTRTLREDSALIHYLMRHSHTTPFEMCVLKFHLSLPISVARQLIRHRTASVNEYSTRYSEAPEAVFQPETFRTQSVSNKQGSGEALDASDQGRASTLYEAAVRGSKAVYQGLRTVGVTREQAREVLPLCQYTEMYWQMNLHNLLHFLELRLHEHAQKEIRTYADAIAGVVNQLFPITWHAFVEHRLHALMLSRSAVKALQTMLQNDSVAQAFNAALLNSDVPTREQTDLRNIFQGDPR